MSQLPQQTAKRSGGNQPQLKKRKIAKRVVEEAIDHIEEEGDRRENKRSLCCRAQDAFRYFAGRTAAAMGSPLAFVIALATVIVWAACGRAFHYSENWQLVINTGTTIVTFLMIFLVQNTQNRESRAIQLKLDELLRGVQGARTDMVDLEDATDEELEQLQHEFEAIRKNPPKEIEAAVKKVHSNDQ